MPVTLGAPAAHGFNEPLGLLSDCHRRIEHFLGILHKVAGSAGASLDASQRTAVETALTYFRVAAPRHNEDEENSLFPLLRNSPQPEVAAAFTAIDALEHDHAAAAPSHLEVDRLYRQWIDAGTLTDEERQSLTRLLDDLIQMYQQHIQVEETKIFTLAADVLDAAQLTRVGTEMAARRGLQPDHIPNPKGVFSMSTTSTIDVRTIPGPQRHPLIFQTFDGLQTGEALEIINDHDPAPLRNQFGFMKKGQFAWDYLQQGPDLWRVRISRTAAAPARSV